MVNEREQLSRRERQIMDIIYGRDEAAATHVMAGMGDAPSRATVRTLLRILEAKGHLKHHKQGREFIYRPTRPRGQAGRSALGRVVRTFFGGSLERAAAAHLSDRAGRISDEELARLSELIRRAREKGESA